MKFSFEVPYEAVVASPDEYVDAVFGSLTSGFLVMPRGEGFLDYPEFEEAYERLKADTAGFSSLDADQVLGLAARAPVILIVLRSMLGFTPPEWAYAASARTGVSVTQGYVRGIDRRLRMDPHKGLTLAGQNRIRLRALVSTACDLLAEGCPEHGPAHLHRLDKADTADGLASLRRAAEMGVPYAMLLYERFLGRPFAGHRDSVSELVGDALENAIQKQLSDAGISHRRTKRAERVPRFDQTPDFIVPSEFNPRVVIEAKLTEDDGTARDKVTRVQHLAEMSAQWVADGGAGFELVACIAGRGFAVRREDMRKLLEATKGKVFTLATIDRLVECTRLSEYVPKHRP